MRSVISKEGHSLCIFALSYGRNVEITNFLLEYSYKNLLDAFSRAFFVASILISSLVTLATVATTNLSSRVLKLNSDVRIPRNRL